jgi:hypothetical protein
MFPSRIVFSVGQQPSSDLSLLIVWVSISPAIRHTQQVWLRWTSGPSVRRRGRYLHNTQQTWQMTVHVFSGLRARDPSSKAAADPRPRTALSPGSESCISTTIDIIYLLVFYFWCVLQNTLTENVPPNGTVLWLAFVFFRQESKES